MRCGWRPSSWGTTGPTTPTTREIRTATITTRDRLALVTVTIKGDPYVIVDIGMRMLTPLELFLIQGFPKTYKIDVGHDGRRFSNKAKVKMCGNSVSPKPYYALLKANPLFPEETMREAA